MDSWVNDVRYALRTLRDGRGASAAMLVALVLGTGATTAIFSVVNGVWLKELPYPDAERIVAISEVVTSGRTVSVTTPNFYDWREQSRSLQAIAVHAPETYPGPRVVLGGSQPVRTLVSGVSEDFFEVLQVGAHRGRLFRPDEHLADALPVALVSEHYWRTQLGARDDFADTALTIDDTRYDVVGVLPAGFHYPAQSDVWVPWRPYTPGRRNHNWVVIARLRDGVGVVGAQREISGITRALKESYGDDMDAVDARVVPLREELVGSTRQPLALLFGAATMLLLVACANVASVQLARGLARRPELAVRSALGAAGARLVRQLFVESTVLATAGGALGLAAGAIIARGLLFLAPEDVASASVGLDYRVLVFAALLAGATAVLFGLTPALLSARVGSAAVLRSSGRGQTGGGRRGWQAMVVVEVALALMLLVGAGLLLRSLARINRIDAGFRTQQVLTVDMSLPQSLYADDEAKASLFKQLEERLHTVPGVAAAGLINRLPLVGTPMSAGFDIEGSDERGSAAYRVVNGAYFDALDIPLVRGRLFDERDRAGAPDVVLINAALAEQTWPGEEPLGRRIGNFGNDNRAYRGAMATVVGIVGDVRDRSLTSAPEPTVFVPVAQRPYRSEQVSLTLRLAAPAEQTAPGVRQVVADVAPEVPIEMAMLDARMARLTARQRFMVLVLGAFAAAALLLAAVGIYGVVSYTVAQRSGEIGVRMALGATGARILALVLAASLRSVMIGVALGGAGALALAGILGSLLFEVEGADPATFAVVVVLLVLVAGVASFVPARRSARIDPMSTIRRA